MVNGHSHSHILELITKGHVAGDHIFGLVPLMASLLNGAGGTADGIEDPRLQIDFDKPVSVFFSTQCDQCFTKYSLFLKFMVR